MTTPSLPIEWPSCRTKQGRKAEEVGRRVPAHRARYRLRLQSNARLTSAKHSAPIQVFRRAPGTAEPVGPPPRILATLRVRHLDRTAPIGWCARHLSAVDTWSRSLSSLCRVSQSTPKHRLPNVESRDVGGHRRRSSVLGLGTVAERPRAAAASAPAPAPAPEGGVLRHQSGFRPFIYRAP